MVSGGDMGAIDEAAFGRLTDFIGASGLKPLVEACVEDLCAAVERMARAVEEGNAAQVKRVAHMMAGVLAQYACIEIAHKARALSHAPDGEALSGAGSLVNACGDAIEDLKARANSM